MDLNPLVDWMRKHFASGAGSGHKRRMHVYFLGIGGTAMGNIACLWQARGHRVSGSDERIYSPMAELLEGAGIAAFEGYDPARLQALSPDLVIVGNAFSRGNAEVEWLLSERLIPFTSLPEFIGREIIGRRPSVVVTGTHGKTTTTALCAHLLREASCPVGYLVGGVPRGWSGGAADGSAEAPFVIEGDEYDSAFFDKRSKFIHYRPRIAIINTIEFDHADIFRDFPDVLRTFQHFTRLVPAHGCLLVNGDEPATRALGEVSWTQVYTVGEGSDNALRLVDFAEDSQGSSFTLLWKGKLWGSVQWLHTGLYNARNAAMAALAAGLVQSPADPTRFPLRAMGSFAGVARRQEPIGQRSGWQVLEDFGHHPTALRFILQSARQCYPGHRLWAVFEPRSNTLRTNLMAEPLRDALSLADAVYMGKVDRAEALDPTERLDTVHLARQLAEGGCAARAFADNRELGRTLCRDLEECPGPGLVVLFSNGSFDGLSGRMKEWCQDAGRSEAKTSPFAGQTE